MKHKANTYYTGTLFRHQKRQIDLVSMDLLDVFETLSSLIILFVEYSKADPGFRDMGIQIYKGGGEGVFEILLDCLKRIQIF